jgi:hypothetical protein
VLLPSDHYVAEERVLHDALVVAVHAACEGDPPVTLLGISPTTQEAGYGWIVPESPDRFARVRRFAEKPPATQVREMIRTAPSSQPHSAARAHAAALIARVPDTLRAFQVRARANWRQRSAGHEALPSMDLSRRAPALNRLPVGDQSAAVRLE